MPSDKAHAVEQRLSDHVAGGYDPVAGAPAIETWHSLGALGVSGITLAGRYRMGTDGETEFDVSGSATGTVSAGTGTFANTLPAAYRPARERDIPALFASALGRLRVGSSGTVQLQYPDLSAGNVITANGRVPPD